jgi:hypothetical protein
MLTKTNIDEGHAFDWGKPPQIMRSIALATPHHFILCFKR